MNTLSGPVAHNAVAGVVQMYASIIADHVREVEFLKQELKRQAAEIANLKSQGHTLEKTF